MKIRMEEQPRRLRDVAHGGCFLLNEALHIRVPGDLVFGLVSCLGYSEVSSSWVSTSVNPGVAVTPVWLDAVDVRVRE